MKNFTLEKWRDTLANKIGVKVCNKQTDRQTNSLAPYTGACGFFLTVKFAISLLASLTGGKYFENLTYFFHLFQGRNLCLERNLMNDADDSESCPLIQKSTKDLTTSTFRQNDDRSNEIRPNDVTTHLGHVARLLPHQNAIPYVKNDFR